MRQWSVARLTNPANVKGCYQQVININIKVIYYIPRMTLYVIYGLLKNSTSQKYEIYDTDTHNYTNIIFVPYYLLR
ncbi:MAG: Tn3 family transposase [Piscirickettsiaceae bacterium]|nr:Tn3 family transposase [Piscirickettsiaceae bacterium]